jgi:hypothetical protein
VIDTLLVVVSLLGVGQTTVRATLTADSVLVLEAPPVFAMLGLGTPAAPTVSLDALRRRYPAVTFEWQPRELTVVVTDPRGVLPASAAARSAVERVARGQFTALSGPFAILTGDDQSRTAADVGYSWKGKLAASLHGASGVMPSWAATVAPIPQFVSGVAGTAGRLTGATTRLAVGPGWAFGTWTPQGWSVDALAALPHVALFASTRKQFIITLTAAPVGIQFGRSGGHNVARATYGPVAPSPFVVPTP